MNGTDAAGEPTFARACTDYGPIIRPRQRRSSVGIAPGWTDRRRDEWHTTCSTVCQSDRPDACCWHRLCTMRANNHAERVTWWHEPGKGMPTRQTETPRHKPAGGGWSRGSLGAPGGNGSRECKHATLIGVEEGTEDARRVESRGAKPIDGPVGPDERDAVEIPDEPVVGDRQVLSDQSSTSRWRSRLHETRTLGAGEWSVAITAVTELVHEPRTGGKPTEFGSRPGRRRALVEQQHLGEVVPEAGASFLI